MSISLVEGQILNEMAGGLYEFLPGSGNRNFSFPLAATQAGVAEFWNPGSKRPAILRLLEGTLDRQRHRFCPLILAIVRLSMGWRSGKGEPLTVQEIDGLNALLLRLAFKIPELHDRYFREGLAGAAQPQQSKPGINEASYDALARELADILNLEPTPRGFAFERLLTDAFALFDLAPRGSFRLVGEQIDGSFQLDGETYLLEAKWQKQQVGNRELQGFAGSVHSKSAWTRGLFVSCSGFSSEGLDAFARGNATRIICMEGQELWQVMTAKLNLAEVLALKARKAAETGRALVPVSTLYKVF